MVLFTAPFFVIDSSNKRVGKAVGSLGEALLRLRDSRDAVTLVGTLVDGVKAVDVDLVADTDPMLGESALEALVGWCADRDVRYQPRESGRPGHSHLIVRLGDGATLDVDLQAELELHLAQLARRLPGVRFDLRSSVRPLSAPHRHGRPTRLLRGTLRPQDVVPAADRPDLDHDSERRDARRRSAAALRMARDQARSAAIGTGEDAGFLERDDSPSGLEFGAACAMARARYTAAAAWPLIGPCAVGGRGQADWLRFHWLPALTIAAAEQGLAAEAAWDLVVRECPQAAEEVGEGEWRQRWQAALVEASTDRPRRRRVPRYPGDHGKPAVTVDQAAAVDGQDERGDSLREAAFQERDQEVQLLRGVLRDAVDREVAEHGYRSDRARSLGALADTFAEELAADGRVSQRRLAVASELSRSTVQLRLPDLLGPGLIRVVASYRQDGQPCDVYRLGPAGQSLVDEARKTRSRSCTPPHARLLGHADPAKLRARHQAERLLYRTPTLSSVDTEKIETAYPDEDSPARPLVRGRMRQRQWWEGLSEREQDQRRAACRARLDAMPQVDRDTWIAWLAQRDLIDGSIDRVLDGTAEPVDLRVVERAPLTVHHGRRDPLWRVGGTQPRQVTASAPLVPVQGELGLVLTPVPAEHGATRAASSGASRARRGLTRARPSAGTAPPR